MRAALAVLVSMLVLVAAGCGSEDVGAGEASGAELLKAGALVYWEIESDPDSDQWKQVEELIRRFPDGDKWLAELEKELEADSEIDWEDVRPALGGQSAFAVYAKSIVDVDFVGVMNPDDPDKLIELVERLNKEEDPADRLVARRIDDWVALSNKEASIDAALKGEGGQALSDVESFKDGMAELPDDALTRIYVDVAAALEAFGGADPESAKAFRMLGLNQIDFAGAWAKARDDGAEIAGALRGEGADKLLGAAEEYTSNLLDLVPADAFAFTTFQGGGATAQFDALRDNPLYAPALREFEQQAGVKVEDIVGLFKGEVAFYAAPGTPIPELTLLLEADDPAQARASAERILRSLAERTGGEVREDGDVTTAVFEGFSVFLGTGDGAVVVSTSKDPFASSIPEGEGLAGTDRYKQGLEAAEAPEEYTGLAYVDLRETIELLMGFATSSGETVPPEISRNLAPLRSVVVYGEKDGDLGKSLLFVEIQE